jgi:hypothetical protein
VDFQPGDHVDLMAIRGEVRFRNFDDVLSHARDTLTGVLIDLGDGDSVFLRGIFTGQLEADDFFYL